MAKETYNPYGFFPADADRAHIGWYPVKTTQSLKRGDPVILDSGQVAVAVSNSSTELLGIMAEDASSLTAGVLVPVYDDPATEFFGRASADASSTTIGAYYDLTGTTGAFEVNVAASSQDLFTLLGVKTGDTSSNAGAHLRVKLNKHALADTSS